MLLRLLYDHIHATLRQRHAHYTRDFSLIVRCMPLPSADMTPTMSSDDADDVERRQEEWTALLAIYGEEAVDGAPDALEWRVSLGERCGWLEVHLPLDYPSRSPPAPVILAPGLPDAPRAALALELHALHEAGAEVVYLWAEHLREVVPSLLLAGRLASTDLCHTADHAAAAAAEAAAAAAEAAEAEEAPSRLAAPPTARYGLTFDPAACDPAHAVEMTSGY